MKKIGLICLCLASLSLVGCFHIPDEDWLLSKDKANSGNIQKDEEMQQAINSFMDGINMISSEWNETKNDGVNNKESEMSVGTGDKNIDVEETIENEEVLNEEIINTGNENQEVEENPVG